MKKFEVMLTIEDANDLFTSETLIPKIEPYFNQTLGLKVTWGSVKAILYPKEVDGRPVIYKDGKMYV
jgi:hypothetical protein